MSEVAEHNQLDVSREHPALTQANEPATIMAVIARAASDPATDVDKLERLMQMYERLEAKKAETQFNDAMNAAQGEIGRIATDAENKQTKSRYATYAALDRILRPIYTSHGFSLSFDTGEAKEDAVNVLCYVSHKSGHTRQYHVDMPADGKGAKGGDVMTKTHAAGSAMQYGQRYLLKLIFNVAIGTDDDGNNASGGVENISEQQAADIECLITEVNADKAGFLKFMGVEKISDISAKNHTRAVKALEKKRGKK